MKRTAIAVSIWVGIAPPAAFAFDWSLRTGLSETIELNSNQFLRTSPSPSVGFLFDHHGQRAGPYSPLQVRFRRRRHLQKVLGPGR